MVAKYPRASQINAERSRVREQQLANVFSALTRAASLNREAAEEIACRTLRHHPHLWRNALGVAIAQGGPFVCALEDLINSGADLPFKDILKEISPGDASLRRVALAATNRLVTCAQPGTEEQLYWQILLTKRLLEMYEWAKALTSAEKALELCRVLSEGSPSAYAVQFAEVLTLLGRARYNLGATSEAIDAFRVAVKLYRELGKSEPSGDHVKLVDALTELASILRANGDHGEALDAMREALRFRLSMNGNLSVSQIDDEIGDSADRAPLEWDTEKMAEVLKHARDGVESYRVLAESSPEAYTPDLAASLNNLVSCLSSVGDRDGALEAALEVAELYKGLAESSPEAYTPNLAASLNSLANRLSEVGDRNEALEAARKAVELYRALAEDSPEAYTPNLAESLNNLANRLSEVGDRDGALEAARDAVELYQGLASVSTPYLARSLCNLADCLSAVGRLSDAVVVAGQAAELYRALAEASPQAYQPDLARTLVTLANHLSAVGEQDWALGAAREAVRLRRALVEASPATYTSDLAMSLTNLAIRLSEVGERNGALVAAREAVELYRGLAEASPAAYTSGLAMSLSNLANCLSGVGERNGALVAAREAVELYRGLAEASPQAYTPNLATSLNNLADILAADGRSEEAQAVFVEGIERFSPGVRARLLVARATWRDDGGEAGDVVAAAREADSTDAPVLLGPVRRMIARAITDAGISDTGLPRWATVDAESATSRIQGWLECSDLAQGVAFLEAQWSSPLASERETLAAIAELYVDLPPVAALAALVERIADEGIQAVTTDLRTHHRAQLLARVWREAHLNGRGASFLREYMRDNPDASRNEGQISEGDKQESEEWDKDLGDPDMRTRVLQVLAATLSESEAVGMMSVLALAQLADPGTAYDAHGSDEGAEDVLRELLEARNWRAMVTVLGVRPSVSESTYGRIALLLSAAVNDEPVERLRELYDYANEQMDAIHRRHLQTLLDKALGTDQCPKSFSDLLLWVKE